jgi:hypothetical protein
MDWANPLDPVKPTQSNPKKVGWAGQVGGYIDFKNEKPIKKIGFQVKPDPTQKIHRSTSVMFF